MTTGHYVCSVKRKINKEDIIQSGYDLFYEKGYGVTGISEITERIDIPKGSFYNHFKSKEEFGIAVLDYYMSGNIKFLKKSLLNENQSPLENLKKFFKDYIELQEKDLGCTKGCLMGNLTMELADVNKLFQERAKEGFESVSGVFNNCLQNAVSAGELSQDVNTSELSNFIINSLQGATVRMKADKNTDSLRNFYNMIFQKLI